MISWKLGLQVLGCYGRKSREENLYCFTDTSSKTTFFLIYATKTVDEYCCFVACGWWNCVPLASQRPSLKGRPGICDGSSVHSVVFLGVTVKASRGRVMGSASACNGPLFSLPALARNSSPGSYSAERWRTISQNPPVPFDGRLAYFKMQICFQRSFS